MRGDHVLIAGDHVMVDEDPAIFATHRAPDGGTDLALLTPPPPHPSELGSIGPCPHTLHLAAGDRLTVMRAL